SPRVRAAAKRVHAPHPPVPEWIDSDAAARTNLAERIAMRVEPRAGERYAQADTRLIAASGYQVHSDEIEDRAASRDGMEQRNPLYDRRIIEFALGLPEEQRRRGGTAKYVLRRAVAGVLPDAIRLRRDKAEFSG